MRGAKRREGVWFLICIRNGWLCPRPLSTQAVRRSALPRPHSLGSASSGDKMHRAPVSRNHTSCHPISRSHVHKLSPDPRSRIRADLGALLRVTQGGCGNPMALIRARRCLNQTPTMRCPLHVSAAVSTVSNYSSVQPWHKCACAQWKSSETIWLLTRGQMHMAATPTRTTMTTTTRTPGESQEGARKAQEGPGRPRTA